MRAISCVLIIALIASLRAAAINPAACDNTANPNGDKCTASTDNPASTILSCKANFVVVKTTTNNVDKYTCVAAPTSSPCTLYAPYVNAATGIACAAAQPQVPATGADYNTAYVLAAPAAAAVTCAKTTANAVDTYYTASSAATTGTPFTTNPIGSWQCLACPANCINCDPATGKALSPATGTQNGCKTVSDTTKFFLGGTVDATSGLNNAVCSSQNDGKSAYGGNSTANSCTTCTTATNCTTAKCADGYTYMSYANVAGLGNISTIAGVNFTTLDATKVGALQGCYKVSDLNLFKAATTNGVRMAVSALIVAVAAVFAF